MHIYEDIKNRANFDYGIMQKLKAHPVLRAELPCFFFLIDKEEKRIYLNRVNLLNPIFCTGQSCFLSSNWFLIASVCLLINSCDHNWTRCTIRDTRLLDLGSELFPSNTQRMLNENLTRFTQSLLKYSKN